MNDESYSDMLKRAEEEKINEERLPAVKLLLEEIVRNKQ